MNRFGDDAFVGRNGVQLKAELENELGPFEIKPLTVDEMEEDARKARNVVANPSSPSYRQQVRQPRPQIRASGAAIAEANRLLAARSLGRYRAT